MLNNDAIKNYCKDVKKALKRCGCYRRSIIKRLETLAADYVDECPDATEQSFREHFGEPEAYAKESVAMIPEDVLVKKLQTRKRITRLVAVGIAALILVIAVGIFLLVLDQHSANYGYMIEDVH